MSIIPAAIADSHSLAHHSSISSVHAQLVVRSQLPSSRDSQTLYKFRVRQSQLATSNICCFSVRVAGTSSFKEGKRETHTYVVTPMNNRGPEHRRALLPLQSHMRRRLRFQFRRASLAQPSIAWTSYCVPVAHASHSVASIEAKPETRWLGPSTCSESTQPTDTVESRRTVLQASRPSRKPAG